jgi:hypothetical protein
VLTGLGLTLSMDRTGPGMLQDLDLREGYRRGLSRWTWIFAAALLGALVGYLVSAARPEVYQASALLGIGIDRNRAVVPDDITVRQSSDRVRALLLADDTLERAALEAGQAASDDSLPQSAEALRERIRLAERPDGWELIVFAESPAGAEVLAGAWAEASLEQISNASVHALRAAEWQQVVYEASCRLQPAEAGAMWLCLSAPPGGDPEALPASLLAEVEASRGILPVFTYSLLREARATSRPVVWATGPLVLAGAILGSLVGVLTAVWRSRPSADG